jgi:16S rRNA (guanine527-N7)-methyltransferase
MEHLWERHILDSAQLVRFEPFSGAAWADVGAGAGLPGIIIACLVEGPVTLVEPRRLRAEFLHRVSDELRIGAVVEPRKVEGIGGKFDAITARAVAPLPKLLKISAHLSTNKTTWILPKGRGAKDELAEARRSWHGMFHVERSFTDDESFIIVGTDVRARG